MTERPQWAPAEADLEHPSVARVYDYYLGGSHNFESDRAFARKVLTALPEIPVIARDNRALLRRVVRHVCAEGVAQFLDLGSGIPTEGNVHEVACAADAEARVVYVDRDPVAVEHSNHILRGDDRATAVLGDVRDAERILDLAARAGLDLGRPVAVLAIALLHFVVDADRPAELMARFLAPLPAGSHLAISHSSSVGSPAWIEAHRAYNRPGSPSAVRLRTPEEIVPLFGDLEIVDPGVMPAPLWRPDPTDDTTDIPDDYPVYAGVGRKR